MISERDVFIRCQRRLLLHHLFLPWKRRGATLLQVGLESGLQPDFFWEAGFEVSALDQDADLLETVRAESSPKVDFFLGQPDHHPFDDGFYDYVVLAHQDAGVSTRRAILAEALRVASRGVIVLEWNRFSLGSVRLNKSRAGVWPWNLALLARQECSDCRISMLSIVPLPAFTWPGEDTLPDLDYGGQSGTVSTPASERANWFHRVHDFILPVPLGAILGLRIELDTRALTPLGAVTESLRAAAYADKRMAGAGRSVHSPLGTPKPTSRSREDQAT